ncbi:MAG: GNAT family N-acetyltransferase [Chloroflexota bacterium]|nr:GNAT family N-acetyltransferase [Chloroflexota bacterium]
MQITTERLTLIACPPQMAEAAGAGRRQLESLAGARIDPIWLDEDGRGLLSYYAYQLREEVAVVGYGMWLMLLGSERCIIGSAGFKSKPDKRGCVEIGYGISPDYRRQGYTFEAVRALIGWAFRQPDVMRVTAECLPDNQGSKRILEKIGMSNLGMQGLYLRWTLERQPQPTC